MSEERPLNTQRSAVFFHIPKTGGTTFRKILLQLFENSFCYCEDPGILSIRESFDRCRCVEFHVGEFQGRNIYFHKEIIQRQNRIHLDGRILLIMFRDPVDRVISNYFQLKRKREDERKPNAAETLEESLRNPQTHNKQVGYVLGNHPSELNPVTSDYLERAKQILTDLKMTIGITEKYTQSLLLLESVTGMRIKSEPIPIENQTNGTFLNQIDDKTRDYIREKNFLDQELYDFACKLFEEQCVKARLENGRNFDFVNRK